MNTIEESSKGSLGVDIPYALEGDSEKHCDVAVKRVNITLCTPHPSGEGGGNLKEGLKPLLTPAIYFKIF